MLDGLHNGKSISLHRISKEVGRSYFAIWGLCRALEIHTRTVAEADTLSAESRSKHKRTPFDGSEEDRAYITGFANGDLTARQVSGTAIFVSATTTHPAFASLFHELFSKYGHIYQYPMFEAEKGYKWRLAIRLDNSFRFLLLTPNESVTEFSSERRLFSSWLAGILDSDGNINIAANNSHARIMLAISSVNPTMLGAVKSTLEKETYHPVGPYLQFEKGTVTPGWNIKYSKDLWRLMFRTRH